MKQGFDFYEEFMTAEEKEKMLMECVDYIALQASKEDMQDFVIDPVKVKGVIGVYNILKKITKGNGVKVSLKLNEPFKSMGYISVVGKNIIFESPNYFAAISKVASNINIYPKVNGVIQIDFTFHGIAKPIE